MMVSTDMSRERFKGRQRVDSEESSESKEDSSCGSHDNSNEDEQNMCQVTHINSSQTLTSSLPPSPHYNITSLPLQLKTPLNPTTPPFTLHTRILNNDFGIPPTHTSPWSYDNLHQQQKELRGGVDRGTGMAMWPKKGGCLQGRGRSQRWKPPTDTSFKCSCTHRRTHPHYFVPRHHCNETHHSNNHTDYTYYDKLPPYCTVLSRPPLGIVRNVRVTPSELVGEGVEGAVEARVKGLLFDKIPAYQSSFWNSTKYDKDASDYDTVLSSADCHGDGGDGCQGDDGDGCQGDDGDGCQGVGGNGGDDNFIQMERKCEGVQVVTRVCNCCQFDQSTNKYHNPSTNHSTNHSTKHSTDLSTNHSTDLSTSHSTDLSTNHSTDLSTNHSTDLSTIHSHNRSATYGSRFRVRSRGCVRPLFNNKYTTNNNNISINNNNISINNNNVSICNKCGGVEKNNIVNSNINNNINNINNCNNINNNINNHNDDINNCNNNINNVTFLNNNTPSKHAHHIPVLTEISSSVSSDVIHSGHLRDRRILYVGRITQEITSTQLKRLFGRFGEVLQCTVHFRELGDNYGFVTFARYEEALRAVENAWEVEAGRGWDVCFGGRRDFCASDYIDLDGSHQVREEYDGEGGRGGRSYDELLKQAFKKRY